jgi:hypothetical protein
MVRGQRLLIFLKILDFLTLMKRIKKYLKFIKLIFIFCKKLRLKLNVLHEIIDLNFAMFFRSPRGGVGMGGGLKRGGGKRRMVRGQRLLIFLKILDSKDGKLIERFKKNILIL